MSLHKAKLFDKAEQAESREKLLNKFGLPVRLSFDVEKVLESVRMDKKREGELIFFVLLSEIGRSYVEKMAIQDLEGVVEPG